MLRNRHAPQFLSSKNKVRDSLGIALRPTGKETEA